MCSYWRCSFELAPRRCFDPGICLLPSNLKQPFPIRCDAVVGIDFLAPGAIGHVGPIALVESRSALQRLLVDIEDEDLAILVERQPRPGNREELVAHPEESSE